MKQVRHGLAAAAAAFCVGIASVCAARAETQGKLDAFEADAIVREEVLPKRTGRSDSSSAEFVGQLLADLFRISLFYGGAISWQRVSGGDATGPAVAPRAPGEPLIPLARVDVVFQAVEDGIEATDVRCEVGHGPFAVHVDITRYREGAPADALDLVRISGLYRMSFGSHVESDLGFGVLTLRGNATTSKFLFSLPVLVHPGKHWGVEFRPAWSDRVSDYDVAVMLTWDCASLKLGYRWVDSPNESLDGPYAGLSFRL